VEKLYMETEKSDKIIEETDKLINSIGNEPDKLIQVLLRIQKEFHWLPPDSLRRVSERLGVPFSRVRHVATFFKAFSLVPRGKHEIRVCVGTACHVRGAQRVLDAICDCTGIAPGETDKDLKFSLETVNCLGCCALGPVVVVDGEYHGNLVQSQVEKVLKKYE